MIICIVIRENETIESVISMSILYEQHTLMTTQIHKQADIKKRNREKEREREKEKEREE
jgi:hypothetical protein